MRKLIATVFNYSLDGVDEVFDWYSSGHVEVPMPMPTPDFMFHVSAPSAAQLRGLMDEVGAFLTGRRTFEVAGGWDAQHPWDVPTVVTGVGLTHLRYPVYKA